MMTLVYLPINQMYTFLYGTVPLLLHGNDNYFYQTRNIAVNMATQCGLMVSNKNEVFCVDSDYVNSICVTRAGKCVVVRKLDNKK